MPFVETDLAQEDVFCRIVCLTGIILQFHSAGDETAHEFAERWRAGKYGGVQNILVGNRRVHTGLVRPRQAFDKVIGLAECEKVFRFQILAAEYAQAAAADNAAIPDECDGVAVGADGGNRDIIRLQNVMRPVGFTALRDRDGAVFAAADGNVGDFQIAEIPVERRRFYVGHGGNDAIPDFYIRGNQGAVGNVVRVPVLRVGAESGGLNF